MAEWFLDIFAGRLFAVSLERFGDEFLRIEAYCEDQCKHDSAEKYAERKLHDTWSNF